MERPWKLCRCFLVRHMSDVTLGSDARHGTRWVLDDSLCTLQRCVERRIVELLVLIALVDVSHAKNLIDANQSSCPTQAANVQLDHCVQRILWRLLPLRCQRRVQQNVVACNVR